MSPIPTVAEALALLDNITVDAAILDVQLLDRDITPVVLQLIVMRTPIIIHTGTGLPEALHSTGIALPRSEEHTSELQSLMRISYAVFCLKKKTNKLKQQHYSTSKHKKQI